MGPLSFIPAVFKAQFHLLRLLRSILHKKGMDCLLFNHCWNSNINHYTLIYLKNVDFTWNWYLLKPARNPLSVYLAREIWNGKFKLRDQLKFDLLYIAMNFGMMIYSGVWVKDIHWLPILCWVCLLLHNRQSKRNLLQLYSNGGGVGCWDWCS